MTNLAVITMHVLGTAIVELRTTDERTTSYTSPCRSS